MTSQDRYSLRFLFGITTVFAVIFGIIGGVMYVERAQDDWKKLKAERVAKLIPQLLSEGVIGQPISNWPDVIQFNDVLLKGDDISKAGEMLRHDSDRYKDWKPQANDQLFYFSYDVKFTGEGRYKTALVVYVRDGIILDRYEHYDLFPE